MEDAIIRVRGLRTQFGDQVIHDGLDLEVCRGEILGIVGGSGTGKSVLLRTIIGLNRPAAGSIEVFGQDLAEITPEERLAVEQRWGVLFQDGALFSSLTVAQNIEVPMKEHLGMPARLRDVDIPKADLPLLANDTLKNFNANPGDRPDDNTAQMLSLLEAAW